MGYLIHLADILRDAGLAVEEIPGWQARGHGAFAGDNDGSGILGVLAHHTAGAAAGYGVWGSTAVAGYPSLRIVVDGRPGLAGPLCNLGLARTGTWVVVAAGQAWHAGSGSAPWCPADQGNSHLIGVEAESVGVRDDWTRAQRESYPRGVAALLKAYRLGPERAIGHKEWAPARKIDPAFWDMNVFRADVAHWMTTTPEEDDMFTEQDRALLGQLARRVDVGYARDQTLTALGVVDTAQAPVKRTPEQAAAVEPARRVDVGFARDQIEARFDDLEAKLGTLVDLLTKLATPADGKGQTP